MQHVSDDMDELLRRAAEAYPLKTDSNDWSTVEKKLALERSVPITVPSQNKNYKKLLWLLLLLVPFGLYEYYIYDKKSSDIISKNTVNSNAVNSSAVNNNTAIGNLQNVILSKQTKSQLSNAKPFTVFPKNPSVNFSVVVNSSLSKRNIKGKLNSNIYKNTVSTLTPYNTSLLKTDQLNEPAQKKENEFQDNKDIADNNIETTAIKLGDDKKEVIETLKNNEKTKNPQKKIHIQKEHGLYAGIVIGPDISTVKFQSIKNIGISMGVLVGYHINSRISLESGVAWNIKNYYSDGKYFSTKNIPSNYNAKIKNVDGVCNMIEIPVLIKYNLTIGKQYFSASAGLSSYFMKKEKYNYVFVNNGILYRHSSTYKNASTNLLAVANFTVGYNAFLNKNTSLRVEPYLKIPLKGLGVGSLPIMSTGLNIGITKKIYR